MDATKVVNIRIHSYHDRDPRYIYIGRPTLYGNHFTHHRMLKDLIIVPSQEDAVIAFREWLYGWKYTHLEQTRRIKILQNLKELEGKLLGCYCEPGPCHGNVYIDMLEGGYDITIKGKRYFRKNQLVDNSKGRTGEHDIHLTCERMGKLRRPQ